MNTTIRSKLPKIRYISPASIEIGDVVKVAWKTGDIEHARIAAVAKREYDGSMRVFLTRDGHEIFRWHPAHDKEFRVTLLNRAPFPQTPLPGM